MIVVIPSCRHIDLNHLSPLIDAGARFIIVDDSPGSIQVGHPSFTVLNWSDCDRLLGRHQVAVPRGNGACRNLGFYLAWQESDPDEIVVALDDDCVVPETFVHDVHAVLSEGTRPMADGEGRHFNMFDLFGDSRFRDLFPRGFPYSHRLGYRPWQLVSSQSAKVVFNVGLWRGVPDVNAVDCLGQTPLDFPAVDLIAPSALVPPGVFVSVCSGSMQFRAQVIPAVFQLPMNVDIMSGWTVNRYGDIWAGFVLKTLIDLRGESMSVGGPLVHHLRQGPVEHNARKEHLAHLMHDEFLDLVESIGETIRPASYLDMMGQIHEAVRQIPRDRSSVLVREYLGALSTSLGAWIGALSETTSVMA